MLISDNFGNFSDFSYSFDVSLDIPSVANFGFFSAGQDLATPPSLEEWLAVADPFYDDLNYDEEVNKADYDLAFPLAAGVPSLEEWLATSNSFYDDFNYDGEVDQADYDLAFPADSTNGQLNRQTALGMSPLISVGADGKAYTQSTEIPLYGAIPGLVGDGFVVEVYVNGQSMGVVPVDSDGSFKKDKVLLSDGANDITSTVKSKSMLVSPVSSAQTIVVDTVAPVVQFVGLPSHTSQEVLTVEVGYADNSGTNAGLIRVSINGKVLTVDPNQSSVSTRVRLSAGENSLEVSAVDVAGNSSQSVRSTVVLDASKLETVPTGLSVGLSVSGKDALVKWTSDDNASSYNLYRAEKPIESTVGHTPIASQLQSTQFTDASIALGRTYYYALTSVSGAGVEGAVVSANANLTALFVPNGGMAVKIDRSRVTAGPGAISADPMLYAAVSIENLADESVLELASALAGSVYSFTAIDQVGSLLSEQFVTPVELAIPYPLSLEDASSLRAYRLENDQWVEVVDQSPNTIQHVLTIQANQFGTYRLTRVLDTPWDVNQDNVVDIFDLVLVGMNFMKSGAAVTGDVNLDSTVDLFDLVMVAKHFGETYGVVTAAAPTLLAGQTRAMVSMSAEHSTSHNGDLQRQQLDIEVKADVQTPIAGYQLNLNYDPRLLAVVGFEKGDILGEGSFALDPQMMPGRISNIAATQVGDLDSSSLGKSTMVKISFRLKGDLDLALKSVGVHQVVIADQQLRPVPVEVDPSISTDLALVVEEKFSLGQNYPNPFNPETWIPYQLATSEEVLVRIYDASGHLVRQVDVGFRNAGSYTSRSTAVYWDGRNEFGEQVASGVYYYTIHAGDFSDTSKMLLLK